MVSGWYCQLVLVQSISKYTSWCDLQPEEPLSCNKIILSNLPGMPVLGSRRSQMVQDVQYLNSRQVSITNRHHDTNSMRTSASCPWVSPTITSLPGSKRSFCKSKRGNCFEASKLLLLVLIANLRYKHNQNNQTQQFMINNRVCIHMLLCYEGIK